MVQMLDAFSVIYTSKRVDNADTNADAMLCYAVLRLMPNTTGNPPSEVRIVRRGKEPPVRLLAG